MSKHYDCYDYYDLNISLVKSLGTIVSKKR